MKIKKSISFCIAIMLILSVFTAIPLNLTVLADDTVMATPTASTLYFDSRQVSIDGYNILGNNYFKLRDLAYILNGTSKQFQVGWDDVNNAISLTSGSMYIPVGGEMVGKGTGTKTATPTRSTIYLDGNQINLTAYTIEGNNYFRLRDVGQTFNFGVVWDGVNNAISVNTNENYVPEEQQNQSTQAPQNSIIYYPETNVPDFGEFLTAQYSKEMANIITARKSDGLVSGDSVMYSYVYSGVTSPVEAYKKLLTDNDWSYSSLNPIRPLPTDNIRYEKDKVTVAISHETRAVAGSLPDNAVVISISGLTQQQNNNTEQQQDNSSEYTQTSRSFNMSDILGVWKQENRQFSVDTPVHDRYIEIKLSGNKIEVYQMQMTNGLTTSTQIGLYDYEVIDMDFTDYYFTIFSMKTNKYVFSSVPPAHSDMLYISEVEMDFPVSFQFYMYPQDMMANRTTYQYHSTSNYYLEKINAMPAVNWGDIRITHHTYEDGRVVEYDSNGNIVYDNSKNIVYEYDTTPNTSTTTQTEAKSYTVTGNTLNSGTGSYRHTVELMRGNQVIDTITYNGSGVFTFRNIQEGTYSLKWTLTSSSDPYGYTCIVEYPAFTLSDSTTNDGVFGQNMSVSYTSPYWGGSHNVYNRPTSSIPVICNYCSNGWIVATNSEGVKISYTCPTCIGKGIYYPSY